MLESAYGDPICSLVGGGGGGGGVVRAEHFISFRVHGRNLTELAMAGRIL